MGILNWFKRSTPKGYKKINVTFTPEEVDAMNRNANFFAGLAEGQGKQLWVTPKAQSAMQAQGLTEYVQEQIRILTTKELNDEEIGIIGEKAIKAQMKAYTVHNLPMYMFQLANIFELLDRMEEAKRWWTMFLREQKRFAPDDVDEIFMQHFGQDMAEAERTAQRRLEEAEGKG